MSKILNFNNEINIVTYIFFFANANNETDKESKQNYILQNRFLIIELQINYERSFRLEIV